MKLVQKQTHQMNQQQIQNLEILQLSTLDLESYVQELALSNPLVEPEDPVLSYESDRDDELLSKFRWLEENDSQNYFYQHMSAEELNPLDRTGTEGGLEETLFRFISRQLYSMDLNEEDGQAVRFLAACLDDNGYLRIPLEDLA